MRLLGFYIAACGLAATAFGGLSSSAPTDEMGMTIPTDFRVNNRILLKVNGKAISVLDVVRKMDLLFYRQYPELASTPMARYQFYTSSWKIVLSTVIDEQLILADAAEKEIEVTDGDIREEIEALFGPAVVTNIDKLGLTYEEARELIKTELIVQKMNGMMVRSKAMNDVSPQAVKQKYDEYVKANPPLDVLVYRVLSIRSDDKEKGASAASKAFAMLEAQEASLQQLPVIMNEWDPSVQLTISEVYERPEKELSLAYRAVLGTLNIGKFSAPTQQVGKDGSVVTRIFVLEDKKQSKPQSFREMEDKFSREISQKAMGKYSQAYTAKLREQFGITDKYISEMIPDSFQPFKLQ